MVWRKTKTAGRHFPSEDDRRRSHFSAQTADMPVCLINQGRHGQAQQCDHRPVSLVGEL